MKYTKYLTTVVAAIALTIALPSCNYNPSQPSGPALSANATDQIILRAEQAAEAGLATFDLFVHVERDNEAALKELSPEIHAFANTVRTDAPGWIKDLRDATKTFKSNRTATNEANLF